LAAEQLEALRPPATLVRALQRQQRAAVTPPELSEAPMRLLDAALLGQPAAPLSLEDAQPPARLAAWPQLPAAATRVAHSLLVAPAAAAAVPRGAAEALA